MPSRRSLPPATTLGGGFTHKVALSLPERHKVALSRSQALERDMAPVWQLFSRLSGHYAQKRSHIMVEKRAESIHTASCLLTGLRRRERPQCPETRYVVEIPRLTHTWFFNHILAVSVFNHILAFFATLWLKIHRPRCPARRRRLRPRRAPAPSGPERLSARGGRTDLCAAAA